MTIKKIGLLALVPAIGLAAGCTPNDITLGAAAKNNYEAQIIEPDPKYAEAHTTDGNQVANAQTRYRTGNVKKPTSIRTTNSGAGGGSSRGASSGG